MTLAAIVLAADRAPGGDVAAALLAVDGDGTPVERQVDELLAAFRQLGEAPAIEVVLGYDAERIIPLIARDNVEPIVNAAWVEGIASSLRVGATAVPRGTTAALIVDVAQLCDADECVRLVQAHRASGAAIVAAQGGAGSTRPMVVDASVLAELRNLREDDDALGALLARHRVETLE